MVRSKNFIAVLLLISTTALTLPKTAKAQSDSQRCNPIGRIESGESDNYSRGSIICSGDRILNPREMQLFCFANRSTILITGPARLIDAADCSERTAVERTESGSCNREGFGRFFCFIPKGTAEEQFQVLRPNTITGSRPNIEWETVPEASFYTIYLVGQDIRWQQVTEPGNTALLYPPSEPSLTIGSVYEITVTANGEDQQISATASRIINVTANTAQAPIRLATTMTLGQMEPSNRGD